MGLMAIICLTYSPSVLLEGIFIARYYTTEAIKQDYEEMSSPVTKAESLYVV